MTLENFLSWVVVVCLLLVAAMVLPVVIHVWACIIVHGPACEQCLQVLP